MWSVQEQDQVLAELFVCIRRRRLVFVQWTPAIEALLARPLAIERFDEVVAGRAPLDVGPGAASPHLIRDFHAIAQDSDAPHRLGQAREFINGLLDEGREVCLVSRRPRMSFPPCPGSSILDDAFVFHADASVGGSEAPELNWAWGAEAPLQDLTQLLADLGADVLSCLDGLLFDLQQPRDIDADLATASEWEALRGAGLFRLNPTSGKGTVCLPPSRLMPALAEAISDVVEAQPALCDITAGLMNIERRLRRAVHRKAITQFGEKWRGQVVSEDVGLRVLSRASSDAALSVSSVKALRDPLEWLTLGELLELIDSDGWPSRLNRSHQYWQRFAHEVLPIRNRVSHMRLLRRADLATVRYWCLSIAKSV